MLALCQAGMRCFGATVHEPRADGEPDGAANGAAGVRVSGAKSLTGLMAGIFGSGSGIVSQPSVEFVGAKSASSEAQSAQ